MTKKNQHFSWRAAREELGFTVNVVHNFPAESSGVREERRNSSHTDDNLITPLPSKINRGRTGNLSVEYVQPKINNYRLLANDVLYINTSEHAVDAQNDIEEVHMMQFLMGLMTAMKVSDSRFS